MSNPSDDTQPYALHVMTAAKHFGVAPEQVTADQRRIARRLNFGMQYQATPEALARLCEVECPAETKAKNLSALTPDELTKALYHFRGAVLTRAQQWDHERVIERLLGRELELEIDDFAFEVDGDALDLIPGDLVGIIDLDEMSVAIPEEEET